VRPPLSLQLHPPWTPVGLIHRDVKPANMLVDARPDRPDHVYLSDFGLAKGALLGGMTSTGMFLGTLDYSSPEQIESKAVDGQSDQYSLACAAFELLAGSPPFSREQIAAVIWAHMAEPPPPLSARRPDLPAAVDEVFTKALAKAPQDRYGSCKEFADALRDALGISPYRPADGVTPGRRDQVRDSVPDHPATEAAPVVAAVAVEEGMPTPATAPGPELATAAGQESVTEHGPEPVSRPGPEPAIASGPEPVTEAGPQPVTYQRPRSVPTPGQRPALLSTWPALRGSSALARKTPTRRDASDDGWQPSSAKQRKAQSTESAGSMWREADRHRLQEWRREDDR
jgi:serine/threonine protein kinase